MDYMLFSAAHEFVAEENLLLTLHVDWPLVITVLIGALRKRRSCPMSFCNTYRSDSSSNTHHIKEW
jgi:hypothetical protein